VTTNVISCVARRRERLSSVVGVDEVLYGCASRWLRLVLNVVRLRNAATLETL
jgi:hypothetical protein